jgi:hypothetical protein
MDLLSSLNFEKKVSNALQNVKSVLSNTRDPQLPKDVSHAYDDKFALVECLVTRSICIYVM